MVLYDARDSWPTSQTAKCFLSRFVNGTKFCGLTVCSPRMEVNQRKPEFTRELTWQNIQLCLKSYHIQFMYYMVLYCTELNKVTSCTALKQAYISTQQLSQPPHVMCNTAGHRIALYSTTVTLRQCRLVLRVLQ